MTFIYIERKITPEFKFYLGTLHSLEKTLLLGKTEGRRRRGQQRMRWLDGWHHQLNGPKFEQILGDRERQGSLVCDSPWGCKDSDMLSD